MSSVDGAKKRLLEKYSPTESGEWRIFGEDPNCDFGGHHHEPELETVVGLYRDVVDYAVTLPGFFQWGGGGRIEKCPKPKKIDPDTNKKRATLEARKKKLLKEIEQID